MGDSWRGLCHNNDRCKLWKGNTFLCGIEKLKEKKLATSQDYKENRITRDDFIAKKQELDDKIVHLEESLQTSKAADKLSGQTLSREVIETHVERVIVDCLGFFEVIYK